MTSAQPDSRSVIVLGGTHGGLATIRSLGRRGIPVIAISDNPNEFGLFSKYVAERVISPHPSDTQAVADLLVSRADDWGQALLLENTDYFASVIAEHRDRLSKFYETITPDAETTRLFIDKSETFKLAESLGVPYPRLLQPEDMDDLDDVRMQDLSFPLMLKPVRSHEFFQVFGKKLFIADSPAELRDLYQQVQLQQLAVVIQEIIPGRSENALESLSVYIDSTGVVRAEVFNIKIRQIPPMWGVMRVGQTVPPIDDVRDYSHKLLRAVDFRGFADLEFKRDVRDNIPKLIEVNVRLPQNLQMMISSGVDFPWLIYQDKVMNNPVQVNEYQPSYYIDLINDLWYSFGREPKIFLKPGHFLKPYMARQKTFPILSLDDPKPLFYAFRDRIMSR